MQDLEVGWKRLWLHTVEWEQRSQGRRAAALSLSGLPHHVKPLVVSDSLEVCRWQTWLSCQSKPPATEPSQPPKYPGKVPNAVELSL